MGTSGGPSAPSMKFGCTRAVGRLEGKLKAPGFWSCPCLWVTLAGYFPSHCLSFLIYTIRIGLSLGEDGGRRRGQNSWGSTERGCRGP